MPNSLLQPRVEGNARRKEPKNPVARVGITRDSACWRLCRYRHKRHSFATRALESCPEGRDAIARHMVALSTYLGHSNIWNTYWYLEATPALLTDIASACARLAHGGAL
jgi:integrase